MLMRSLKSSLVPRSVRNVVTGIDASVPSFEKVANPRDVKHYHILVVTSKTNVKSGEHSADEVVQFMVSGGGGGEGGGGRRRGRGRREGGRKVYWDCSSYLSKGWRRRWQGGRGEEGGGRDDSKGSCVEDSECERRVVGEVQSGCIGEVRLESISKQLTHYCTVCINPPLINRKTNWNRPAQIVLPIT